MKKNIFIIFLFFSTISFSQNAMIVGYLPTYRFKTSNDIDFCKLTHLNICFVNPNSKGNIIEVDSLPEIMNIVREQNPNIKINISLAGGALYKEEAKIWRKFVDIPKNRPILIKSIIKFVEKYNFDGVDVDLEWKNVTKGYSPFVIELKKELEKLDKKLTAALPGIVRFKHITDEALEAFDYINIMAYDERGSWAPKDAGPHSSLAFANKCLYFWINTNNIPKNKLCLGLPLYGYNFSNPKRTYPVTYKEIIAMDGSNINRDFTGKIFYNGIPTIEEKVWLAVESKLAGVMLWELGQDTINEFSILTAVNHKIKSLKANKSLSNCGSEIQKIISIQDKFKNEVSFSINMEKRYFTIESKNIKDIELQILNKRGKDKTKRLKPYIKNNIKYFKTKRLRKGVYTIIVSNGDLSFKKKLTIGKIKKK